MKVKIGYVALVKGENKGIRWLVDRYEKGHFTISGYISKLVIFCKKEDAILIAREYNDTHRTQYEFEFAEVTIEREG